MISLYHLNYFSKAAEYKSIVRASKDLHVTPSAISQAIQALERDLNTKLISHKRNQFELTEAGKLLIDRGQGLLQLATSIKNDLHIEQGRNEGNFSFITHQSIASTILPPILAEFGRRQPLMSPYVQIGTRDQIQEKLKLGGVSFAITVDQDMGGDSFERQNLKQGRFVLLGSKNSDIAKDVFLLADQDTGEVQHLRSQYLKKFRRELPVKFVVTSWSVIAQMASDGLGIALVPDYVVERVDKRKLHQIPWVFGAKEFTYKIDAVWPKGSTPCGCSRRFLETF